MGLGRYIRLGLGKSRELDALVGLDSKLTLNSLVIFNQCVYVIKGFGFEGEWFVINLGIPAKPGSILPFRLGSRRTL